MVCAVDYEAGDPVSIPGSGGTTEWLFSAGWVLLPAVTRTVDSAGNKSFHPYQVGTFVDYPR